MRDLHAVYKMLLSVSVSTAVGRPLLPWTIVSVIANECMHIYTFHSCFYNDVIGIFNLIIIITARPRVPERVCGTGNKQSITHGLMLTVCLYNMYA